MRRAEVPPAGAYGEVAKLARGRGHAAGRGRAGGASEGRRGVGGLDERVEEQQPEREPEREGGGGGDGDGGRGEAGEIVVGGGAGAAQEGVPGEGEAVGGGEAGDREAASLQGPAGTQEQGGACGDVWEEPVSDLEGAEAGEREEVGEGGGWRSGEERERGAGVRDEAGRAGSTTCVLALSFYVDLSA